MNPYHASTEQLNLQDLPPLVDSPGYRIVRGDPRCAIRFDIGASGTSQRLGIWRCSPGAFECVEKGNELQTILQGSLKLTTEDGKVTTFQQGDSFFTRQGETVTWDIIEEVTKVFFTLQDQ